MRWFKKSLHNVLALICAALLCAGLATAKTTTNSRKNPPGKTSKSSKSSKQDAKSAKSRHSKGKRGKSARQRGQRGIQEDRARAIQAALIREKYLDGEPTGVWDQRTKDAMARYQGDHGWQTKMLPDSRALIQLGLGPNHDNLINPETAATAMPSAEAGKPLPPDGSQDRQ